MKNIRIQLILIVSILSTFFHSCENEVSEVISLEYTVPIKLSKSSLNRINSFFLELDFDGKIYNFNEGEIITPKFNSDFIVDSDTMNFVYLKLYEKKDSILLGVNKLLCYATILPEFEGYYYPNQSVIYPYDFSFLNEEQYSLNIYCRNEDNEKYRAVGYDKNLFGSWGTDSIIPYYKGYNSDFNLQKIKFTNRNALLNDSIVIDYYHSGFSLRIKDLTYDFHKVLVNRKKMILINTYEDSYEVFYFSKLE